MTQAPEPPERERSTNDPDEITRRGGAGRRLILLVAGVALVVVLVVWLVVYLTARETSDESMGAGALVGAVVVAIGR